MSTRRGTAWMEGNPNLKPETSTSYELSANYQETNWMVEATVYRNNVDNLINRDFNNQIGEDSGRPVYTYKNTDKARIDGVELGGRVALTETLSLKGDFTFTDARDQTTGELLTNRPRQSASTRFDWQTSQKLTTFVRATYSGKQKLNDTTDLNGYTLMDLGMNYQVNKLVRVRAGVSNVANKRLSDEVTMLGYSEDPRTWYVGFTSNF